LERNNMASFLDILSQNYTDPRGRFNPFAAVRGFTPTGRREIDEQQRIAELQRQQTTGGLTREQDALGFMAGQPNPMTATPSTPEEAAVIQQLLQLGQGRTTAQAGSEALRQSQEAFPVEQTSRRQRNLGQGQEILQRLELQPHVVAGAEQANLQAGANLYEQLAGQDDRIALGRTQASEAERQAGEARLNAPLVREGLRQGTAVDPRVAQYLNVLPYVAYDPALRDQVARMLGLSNMAPAPQEDVAGRALQQSIDALTRSKQGGGQAAPQQPTSPQAPQTQAAPSYQRYPLQGGTVGATHALPQGTNIDTSRSAGPATNQLQPNVDPRVMEMIRRIIQQSTGQPPQYFPR
jgi:hypothetical protein